MLAYGGSTTFPVPRGMKEESVFACDEAFFLAARELAEKSLATPEGRSVVGRSGKLTMEPLSIQYPEELRRYCAGNGWNSADFYVFDRGSGRGWCGELVVNRRGDPGSYEYSAVGWIAERDGSWHDLVALVRDAGLPVD